MQPFHPLPAPPSSAPPSRPAEPIMQRLPPRGSPVIDQPGAGHISPDAMPCTVKHRGCDEPTGAGGSFSRPRRSAPVALRPVARVPAKPRLPTATACRPVATWSHGRPGAVRISPDAMPCTVRHRTGDARAPAGWRFHLARRYALHREKSRLRRTDWRRWQLFSAAPIRAACAASGCPRPRQTDTALGDRLPPGDDLVTRTAGRRFHLARRNVVHHEASHRRRSCVGPASVSSRPTLCLAP